MSEENVAIVRGMYDAYDRGDAGAALAYFDAEVLMDASHRVDGRVGHGREEMCVTSGVGSW